MKLIILTALALLLNFQHELAHAQCSGLFASQGSVTTSDSTDRLISYLSQLLENNAIGERELVTLREGDNPIPHQQTEYGPVFETSARRIQYQVVQGYFQTGRLDHAKIAAWVEKKLQEKSRGGDQREEVREETRQANRRMEFHRLPPGEFNMGQVDKQFPVKLTQVIEMMSTPITQKMWVEVMGENPSHFKEGPESVKIEINGNMFRMRPDHPVENVTWWSVIVFANRLSELNGLKPAYDLSEVETTGRAEDGTLEAVGGRFGRLKIIAPDGDIYQAEGFRLPTEAEQEYVLRNLGRATGEFPHDLRRNELEDYGWFDSNAGGTTHGVGTTWKSLSIDGKVFDDLVGNVGEWNHDCYLEPKAAVDPIGSQDEEFRHVRFGSWNSSANVLRSGTWGLASPNNRTDYFGARLVRTIK